MIGISVQLPSLQRNMRFGDADHSQFGFSISTGISLILGYLFVLNYRMGRRTHFPMDKQNNATLRASCFEASNIGGQNGDSMVPHYNLENGIDIKNSYRNIIIPAVG